VSVVTRQSQSRQATTSDDPIVADRMVAIDTVLIKRRQSARNTNASNAMRNKATATNSVLKLQGGLAGKHDKSIMRVS
jgi:hypothetical protein